MSGKRKDLSDQSASRQARKQRVISNDLQWACENKESLTVRAYAEKFGVLDKQQAMVRYRNIIKSPLLAVDKARLDQELHMYKQTEDFKRFWLERTRSKTNLDAHDTCATFIQDVVDQEACLLNMQPRIASAAPDTSDLSLTDDATESKALSEPTTPTPHATITTADTTPTNNDQDIFVSTPDTILDDVRNAIPLQPWMYRGTNVAERFMSFKRVVAGITINQLLFIEPSVHELLALSNILLLCTSQHSPLCIDTFTEDLLDDLNKDLLTECMDFKVDISDDACMKLARIIVNVDSKQLAKDDADIELLMLGKSICPLGRSLVRGISAAMRRLPLIAIKNKQTIGECELFTMYFDPILTSLLSDPDRKVLLRWSNVTSDENGEIRPDATISKLWQRDFGSSLGYGEVKIARPTIDNHALCHDLLRLATLAKDTIDTNSLEAALTFQVHGFHITFFLTRLRHDGIYVMQELSQLTFPRSLQELATFVSLKNMRTLMILTDTFWRLCRPVRDPHSWQLKRRPTHPSIYSLIDSTKNRHRFCALRFD